MKLIFLSGVKRSGKDTTADFIMSNYSAVKYQLAGPIKDALAYAWGVFAANTDYPCLTRKEFEGIDYDRETNLNLTKLEVITIMEQAFCYLNGKSPIKGVFVFDDEGKESVNFVAFNKIIDVINNIEDQWSVRRLMQALGTDLIVNNFDRMYWVKLFALDYLDKFNSGYDYYIVPDTRQDHEMDAARAMGATVIHVVRPGQKSNDTHITEAGLPIRDGDLVITNDGSLEELFSKIKKYTKGTIMSEQTIEQKLSAEIVTLKSRILDTQDQAARLMEESKILQGTLAEIAHAVGITGDTIKVEEIVEAVKNLTAESADEE